jgi:hypothetical protein
VVRGDEIASQAPHKDAILVIYFRKPLSVIPAQAGIQ